MLLKKRMKGPSLPELMQVNTASKILGLSWRHVKRLCESGEIVAQNCGTDRVDRWVIHREDMIDYMTRQKVL